MKQNIDSFQELYRKGFQAFLEDKNYKQAEVFYEEAHFTGVFATKSHFLAHYAKFRLALAQKNLLLGSLQIFLMLIAPITPLTFLFYKLKIFLPMHPTVKKMFEDELKKGHKAFQDRSLEQAWYHFGRAHILGSHFCFPHVRTHFWMLRIEWLSRSPIGIGVQISRFLGAFGTRLLVNFFGVTGNPGWSKYPIGTRLSLEKDLKNLLTLQGLSISNL